MTAVHIETIQVYKVAGAAFLATLKNHTAFIVFPGIFLYVFLINDSKLQL